MPSCEGRNKVVMSGEVRDLKRIVGDFTEGVEPVDRELEEAKQRETCSPGTESCKRLDAEGESRETSRPGISVITVNRKDFFLKEYGVSIGFRSSSDVRGDVVQIYSHFSRKNLRAVRVTILFSSAPSLPICTETVRF